MKLTGKQALIMFDILKHSLRFHGGFAGYSREDLLRVINDIIEQQSDEPVEYGGFAGYSREDLLRVFNDIIEQQSDEPVELRKD